MYVLLWIAFAYSRKDYNLDDLNETASEALLNLLMTNKGLYIKIGQAIANQGSLFPLAFQKRFARLYDDAPFEPWRHVDKTLKKNLGANYEMDLFISIDHNPVASASIAQVHKGILKNGQSVALKVQHGYIEKQVVVDLWVYRVISRLYEKVFDIPMTFFSEYVSKELQTETNFVNEMQNTYRLAENNKKDKSKIYIPTVYPELTTRQVLVTEWIDGVSLNDKQQLIDSGFDLQVMMKQYIELLGKQIFKHGFVHSDPHPGNLKARYVNGEQQLVLLDHGLYLSLNPRFRHEYAELWKNIFLLNTKGIESIGKKWGINSVELFATVILLRPITAKVGVTDDRDMNRLLKDFLADESKFPKELLFLTRDMRMIQNLNQSFGSPVNRINLLTKELIDALLNSSQCRTTDFKLLTVKLSLFFSNVIFYLIRIRQICFGDRYGGKGIGIEDYLEVYMKNTVKSIGIEWI